MDIPSCKICETTESLLRCGKCKTVYYCSTNHQHLDWPTHKLQCKQLARIKNQQKSANNWPSNSPNSESNAHNSAQEIIQTPDAVGNELVSEFIQKESTKNTVNIKDEKYLSLELSNTNERSYEDLCRNIISDMNTYGLSVVDDFLGLEKGLQILNEVHKMYAAGVFRDGQLVSNTVAKQDLRTIRGDKITWVKGTEGGCSNIGYLVNQIDAVVCKASTMQNNGLIGNYKIRERTKAMVACYPGSGSHYVMHVDNPNKDGRVITAIYYLNIDWDIKRSGGVLRICPENGGTVADIEPKFDRLIFFWSDRRNPHEVQPAHRTRYAITVWYFDANEREAALSRYKPIRNNTNNCT